MPKKTPTPYENDFSKAVGMPLTKVIDLYTRAVENDWRTVQATTQQVISQYAASRAKAQEATELLNLARAILSGENKDHLQRAGLRED
jgi:hypothetical protein